MTPHLVYINIDDYRGLNMITKAIVEEVLSPYEVKVRVPILDRSLSSSLATSTENLNTATICSLPNCYTNPQVGDVVFVGFEDNTYYKAVILGYLTREAMTPTYSDITFGNLTVNSFANLPLNTTIGDVTSQELVCLNGIKDNIQKQINNLEDKLNKIKDELKSLTSN